MNKEKNVTSLEWWSNHPPGIYDDVDHDTPAGRLLDSRILEYPSDPPGSFVVSGPLSSGQTKGRWFATERDALIWACGKYGPERVKLLDSGMFGGLKWAVRVSPEIK